jgi:hypothetical protein
MIKTQNKEFKDILLNKIKQAKITAVIEENDRYIVYTDLESLFLFQLAIYRYFHPETSIIKLLDSWFKEFYDSMSIVNDLIIDEEEFKGECYVSKDKTGTRLWTHKPIKNENNIWVPDPKYGYKPSTYTKLDGSAIHIFTGEADTDKTLEVDLNGLYKLKMSNTF